MAILIGAAALLVIIMSGKLFEDVDTKKIIVNQVPITGTIQVWTEPGLEVQMFGTTTEYDKAQQYWFSNLESEGRDNSAIAIKNNDGSQGTVSGSVLVRMPLLKDKMTIINNECGSMRGVMQNIVTPNINKVIFASGALMSPFEAYAEKRNDLIEYIDDQLKYGVYKTVVEEIHQTDSLTGEHKTIKLARRVSNSNAPGGFERQEDSPFAYYGIGISQLSISDFDFSPAVRKQIEQQQKSNMSIETAIIEVKAAQQKALKVAAEGQAAAEQAKWEQEKLKIVAVTKAQQEYEVASLEAKKAHENAKKILAEGRAEAEANRLKVAAGLTPLEKATIEKETAIGVARELANSKQALVPEIMVVGGDGKSGSANPLEMVGLNMMMEITQKMNKNK